MWQIEDGSLAYDIDDHCVRIAGSWEFGKRKYVHELESLVQALYPNRSKQTAP